MSDITELKLAERIPENERAREHMRNVFDVFLAMEPLHGFALIGFRREGDKIATYTEYGVNDAIDIFLLPELARSRLLSVIQDQQYEEN